jgi:2-haloacid dehalogenase
MSFDAFTHLSFDCYGTLIDWENGILDAVKPILADHGIDAEEAEILRTYAELEGAAEAGAYRRYRTLLSGVLSGFGERFGFTPTVGEIDALPDSVGNWPAFPDSAEALRRLKTRFKLVVISNIDDEMFAHSARRLEMEFDEIVTAQQVGSYKPSHRNFQVALQRVGVPVRCVLHCAQSRYHDHVPAKALGFTTVWVNRASRCPDIGVSLPAEVTPDYEVPDMDGLATMLGV